ncbi:MAG: 1,4-alpha-glucan branching protein [Flavisolibacter sp.]|nr:1,4-alpha-glucan branching protein [Flavisolibacter sp.]
MSPFLSSLALSSTHMKDWIKTTNIYEVNLRQYTDEGTINAFAQHLPRLKDMGVETLWFMPLTPIAQKNIKGSLGSYYACSDFTSVSEEFGTIEDFKSLVQVAHGMGMKVIIDWVANHTGWDHWWTREHPDWYEKDEQTGDFKKASGMDDIIELDFKNPALRHAMINAMKFWITETGIDGFRCDLAFWVELDFWIEAKSELDKIKDLFWLGELDPADHPEYMEVFDAAYTWKWMHKAEQFYKGQTSFEDLLNVLQQYQQLPGIKAWFTTNHDENTWNGTEYEKYGSMAKLLAVFSCTWPGVPLLYSGQELPNYKRLQFFEKDVIEWNEDYELHSFYRTLFELKKKHTALAADASVQILSAVNSLLFFKRREGESEITCLFNFSDSPKNIDIENKIAAAGRNVFADAKISIGADGVAQLPPWGFAVFTN